MEGYKLTASSSPHIRSEQNVSKIMLDVLIALIPAFIASIFYFGINSLLLVVASVASAVLTELLCQKLMKRPVTINDFSAAVTGVLLAFNIPASAPIWLPIIGSFFAIAVAKQIFGSDGPDIVFDCVGNEVTLDTAINLARKGSKIIMVGVPEGKIPVNMAFVQDRELEIIGTIMYTAVDYEATIQYLTDGRMKTDGLVTHHFSLDQSKRLIFVTRKL